MNIENFTILASTTPAYKELKRKLKDEDLPLELDYLPLVAKLESDEIKIYPEPGYKLDRISLKFGKKIEVLAFEENWIRFKFKDQTYLIFHSYSEK